MSNVLKSAKHMWKHPIEHVEITALPTPSHTGLPLGTHGLQELQHAQGLHILRQRNSGEMDEAPRGERWRTWWWYLYKSFRLHSW